VQRRGRIASICENLDGVRAVEINSPDLPAIVLTGAAGKEYGPAVKRDRGVLGRCKTLAENGGLSGRFDPNESAAVASFAFRVERHLHRDEIWVR
jgi:hypothetical protein